jgi:uncharacterized membrane protein
VSKLDSTCEPHVAGQSPTELPPAAPGLTPVLERNIEALCQRRQQERAAASWQDALADRITRFTGSMTFVLLHLIVFGFWIVANLGWIPGVPQWDPSFVVLAMVASVEAIFLSTFVLITQNRMAAAAERRAELDLQISLLTEHEITKVATIASAIAKRVGAKIEDPGELEEIKRDIAPEAVLDKIEEEKGARPSPRRPVKPGRSPDQSAR